MTIKFSRWNRHGPCMICSTLASYFVVLFFGLLLLASTTHQLYLLKIEHPKSLENKTFRINGGLNVDPGRPASSISIIDGETSTQATLSIVENQLKIVTDNNCIVIIVDYNSNQIIYPKHLREMVSDSDYVTAAETDEMIDIPLNATFIIGMPKIEDGVMRHFKTYLGKSALQYFLKRPFEEETFEKKLNH